MFMPTVYTREYIPTTISCFLTSQPNGVLRPVHRVRDVAKRSDSRRREREWGWKETRPAQGEHPVSAQAFGDFACGATARKRVHDPVASSGQELHEELGELNRDAGRIGRQGKSKV